MIMGSQPWLGFLLLLLELFSSCRSQSTNCSGLQLLSASAGGEIWSHDGAGLTNYSNNMRCYWQIGAPSGSRVVAWFTFLEIESSSGRVILYDGVNGSAVIATVNTTISPGSVSPRYVSSADIMTVHFYTSESGTQRGFRLQYNVTSNPTNSTCQAVSFSSSTNTSGLILSHSGFGTTPYPVNMSCAWTLSELSGQFVQLTALNLSLGDGDCVRFITGSPSSGSPTTTFCGWAAFGADLQPLQMGGAVRVEFTSNSKLDSVGFAIRFEYNLFCPANQTLSVGAAGSGEIVSHSGVGVLRYWNNMRCVWELYAPPGKQFMFWVPYLSTQSYYDLINVVDMGANPAYIIISGLYGELGSVSNPTIYESTSNFIRIIYNSDASSAAFGFRLLYNVTELYCYGSKNLTAGVGDISSHLRLASKVYLNNMDCFWQINAPVGYRVAVWVTYMYIYDGADWLAIYDGLNGSTIILTYTGAYSPIRFVSSSSIVSMYFHTNNVNQYYGFSLHYEATQTPVSSSCPPINFTNSAGTSGIIISHFGYGYGSTPYPSSRSCLWTLPQRTGYYIFLYVTSLMLSIGDCLRLTSNSQAGSTGNASYCDWNGLTDLTMVLAGDVQVSFTSNSNFESLGFMVRFDYCYSCVNVTPWTADTGEILSHSGAGTTHYLNNVQCNWLISVPPGKQVIAWFTLVSLNGYYDVVTLYDGISGTAILTQYRGGSGYYTFLGIVSSSNYMRVNFITDGSGTAFGFRLQYSTTDYFCPSYQNLIGNGEIVSHSGVNVTDYLNNLRCNWQITAPPDKNVVVRFTFFSLDSSADTVTLYDGMAYSPLVTLRGSYGLVSWVYTSGTNVMRVSFYTDYSNTAQGFRMEYNTTERYCRGVETLTGDTGEMSSHTAVGRRALTTNYYTTCYWVITVPQGKRVLAWLSYFNLSSSSESLTLTDGIIGSSALATLTYSTAQVYTLPSYMYLSSTNFMTVYFYAVGSFGFKMIYSATDSYCQKFLLIKGGSGEVASHSGAGVTQYLNNMACTWQIMGDITSQISASFTLLDLPSITDTVTLLDGVGETLIITVRGGSTSVPTRFLTLSNLLTVRFSTDGTGTGLGFKLQYNTGSEAPTTVSSRAQTSPTIWTAQTADRMTSRPADSTPSNVELTGRPISNSTERSSQTESAALLSPIVIAFCIVGPLLAIGLAAAIGFFVHKPTVNISVPATDVTGESTISSKRIRS